MPNRMTVTCGRAALAMGLVALFAACEKKEAPVTGAAAPAAPAAPAKEAADTGPIKVGILHSLSGTMAISETSLKDVALMAIEEINEAGRRARPQARAGGGGSRPRTGRCSPRRPAT